MVVLCVQRREKPFDTAGGVGLMTFDAVHYKCLLDLLYNISRPHY